MDAEADTANLTTKNPLEGLVPRKALAVELQRHPRTLLRAEHLGMPSTKVFGEVYYNIEKVRAWIAERQPKRACHKEPVRRGRPSGRPL